MLHLYLLTRDTGRLPWEMGIEVSRSKFRYAALILSQGFQVRQMVAICPLAALGGNQ